MTSRRLFAGVVAVTASTCALAYDLVPMWESYLAIGHDSFYTENPAEHASSVRDTYEDHGVAFWLPCAQDVPGPNGQPGITIPNLGFSDDLPMQFACRRPYGAAPLYRFYKGAPATDHFYTTSVPDADLAQLSLGYAYEGVEGFVLTNPVAGSVPLYQLTTCFATSHGCDVEHRYTISADTKATLVRAGWSNEGILGYVFGGYDNPSVLARYVGTLNGYAVTSSSYSVVPVQNVTPPARSLTLAGRGAIGARAQAGAFTDYGYLASNSTARPAGAASQRVTFTLYTGSLFDASTNIDHIPVILYYHAQAGSDGFRADPYDGIGVFFSVPQWGGNACGNASTWGGQIFIERFAAPPDTAHGFDQDNCRSNLAQPLQPRHYYDIVITADDAATLDVTVRDHATHQVLRLARTGALPYSFAGKYACPLTHVAGSLTPAQLYCNNPFSSDRFANFRTGYALWPMFQDVAPANGTGVGAFSNFTVQWLDHAGAVLWSQ